MKARVTFTKSQQMVRDLDSGTIAAIFGHDLSEDGLPFATRRLQEIVEAMGGTFGPETVSVNMEWLP